MNNNDEIREMYNEIASRSRENNLTLIDAHEKGEVKMGTRRPNGAGSINQISDKTFQGRITTAIDQQGKRINKCVYGDSREAVEAKLSAIQYRYNLGVKKERKPSKMTLNTLIEAHLKQKFDAGIIKETTYNRNRATLRFISDIGDIPVQKVSVQLLENFFISVKDKAQSSIDTAYETINAAMREALNRGYIDFNPCEFIMKPRTKHRTERVRAFKVSEQKKFIEVLEKDKKLVYRNQFIIAMFTGMRIGEVNALSVEDIDFDNNMIYIRHTISKDIKGNPIIQDTPKTEAGRRAVPMNKNVREALINAIGDKESGYIFTRWRKPIDTSKINMAFKYLVEKYQIVDTKTFGKITTHSLRHTFATRCIESGMPPKVLQGLLGHTDISITMNTYCDLTDDFKQENAEKTFSYFEKIGIA